MTFRICFLCFSNLSPCAPFQFSTKRYAFYFLVFNFAPRNRKAKASIIILWSAHAPFTPSLTSNKLCLALPKAHTFCLLWNDNKFPNIRLVSFVGVFLVCKFVYFYARRVRVCLPPAQRAKWHRPRERDLTFTERKSELWEAQFWEKYSKPPNGHLTTFQLRHDKPIFHILFLHISLSLWSLLSYSWLELWYPKTIYAFH